tara:strand:- start:103 stop:735 length:633 start_codon:yes stop_codon:yes gene_type:complete
MINLTAGEVNQIIIYADTVSNADVSYGNYFLFGFQDTYSKEYFYVIPDYTTRNTRFINFQVEVSDACIDEPGSGVIFLRLPGNWNYKLWNMVSPSLDPADGDLIDQGQAFLNPYDPPEVGFVEYVSDNENLESEVYMYAEAIEFVSYQSDNENLKSVVYYSGDFFCCVIDEFNSPFIVSEFMESNCDPLYVTGLGFLDITETGELYITTI